MTREEREELERLHRDEELRTQLATPTGRAFFWRVLEGSGAFAQSFTSDALQTAFLEGKRAVGLSLLAEAQRVAPDDYVKALLEALEARKRSAFFRAQDAAD